MAKINVVSINPDPNYIGKQMRADLEALTSEGQYPFVFRFVDQGSPAANDKEARRRLRIVLEEALQELGAG
jgi:hypothetical protein